MRFLPFRFDRRNDTSAPRWRRPVEGLEDRRLLSASVSSAGVGPMVATPLTSPVTALTVHAVAGVNFSGAVGVWTTSSGLPKVGSGLKAYADVSWGDGTSSVASLVQDANGLVQIDGSHTWAKAGTFNTVVNVGELPVGKPGQPLPQFIIEVGQGDGKAIVAKRIISLAGKITGSYKLAPVVPDIGATYVFTGTGVAGALGPVAASGSVSLRGFIATGHAAGTLTLSSISASPVAGGSVTLKLAGPLEKGFGPFPTTLNYSITGGTGKFASVTGSGTISVTLNPKTQAFTFVIHSILPPVV